MPISTGIGSTESHRNLVKIPRFPLAVRTGRRSGARFELLLEERRSGFWTSRPTRRLNLTGGGPGGRPAKGLPMRIRRSAPEAEIFAELSTISAATTAASQSAADSATSPRRLSRSTRRASRSATASHPSIVRCHDSLGKTGTKTLSSSGPLSIARKPVAARVPPADDDSAWS